MTSATPASYPPWWRAKRAFRSRLSLAFCARAILALWSTRRPRSSAERSGGQKDLLFARSVETLFIDSFFKTAGVEKSKVDLISVDIAAKVSTYLGGGGDGMFVPVPLYTIRKNIPRLSRGILFSDYGLPLPGTGLIANETAIREKPKAVSGFVAALQKAWAAIQDGSMTEEAVQALLKNRPRAKLAPEPVPQQLQRCCPTSRRPRPRASRCSGSPRKIGRLASNIRNRPASSSREPSPKITSPMISCPRRSNGGCTFERGGERTTGCSGVAHVTLRGVCKSFNSKRGNIRALANVDLDIGRANFCVCSGPAVAAKVPC